jgi:hypothetical protein
LVTTDTGYNQRIVNQAALCGGLGCYTDEVTYSNGLGKTKTYVSGGDGGTEYFEDDTTLIYYSKSGGTWGVPAIIAMGITNIPQQNPSITLFPTINNGQFKLSINDPNSASPQLIIYDLTGREVKRTNVLNGINNVALDNASAGMYLWSVASEGAISKSGKLIIQ